MEQEKKTIKRTVNLTKNKQKTDKKKIEVQDSINDWIMRQGEVSQTVIKYPKQVGYYKVGKSFHIFFEKKPNIIHRYFSKLLLGWTWINN
jgi:uncharacterized metal-binding protein